MTETQKTDEEAVEMIPDKELLMEAEKEDANYSKLAYKTEAKACTTTPWTWGQCAAGYKSYYCRNAAFSVFTCNGFFSLLSLNAIICLITINGFMSILSLNSVFSIFSLNCAFCIGCEGTAFCVGEFWK